MECDHIKPESERDRYLEQRTFGVVENCLKKKKKEKIAGNDDAVLLFEEQFYQPPPGEGRGEGSPFQLSILSFIMLLFFLYKHHILFFYLLNLIFKI